MGTGGALTLFQGRRAATVENRDLRVTVLSCGGHIAEIFDKASGVNPLWIPPWPSVEPVSEIGSAYGSGSEARLLAGIMGHNVCLDLFGGPSDGEFAAGIGLHGEGPVVEYEIRESDGLKMRADLPVARIRFERHIALQGRVVRIRERVSNLSGVDRPIGWTEHVTLGPPFLARGATEFRASATRSKVFEGAFGVADYLSSGAEFDWPMAPLITGGQADLQVSNGMGESSAFTTHLMDPGREHAFFAAYSPAHKMAIAYVWKQRDFPWMGIWEENHSRRHAPWNGKTLTRGMEFGVSPFPESRRAMVDRGTLFGARCFGWLPANGVVEVEYFAMTIAAGSVPEVIGWPG